MKARTTSGITILPRVNSHEIFVNHKNCAIGVTTGKTLKDERGTTRIPEGTNVQLYGPFSGDKTQLIYKEQSFWCKRKEVESVTTRTP